MFVLGRCVKSEKKVCLIFSCLRKLISFEQHPLENIVCCPSGNIDIPQITVQELVYSKIKPFHKYIATENAVTGQKYTFEQVRVKSRNLSKALRKRLNLQKGDVVAILLPNLPEYLVSSLGILEAGLVITSLNPTNTQKEISVQLKDSKAKTIITVSELYSTAEAASSAVEQHLPIICIKNEQGDSIPRGGISFEELVNTPIDIPDIEFGSTNDLAYLPYSSGTTGLPKGVEITHNNIVSMNAQAINPDYQLFDPPSETFQDAIPGVLPMFHIYGFTISLINGAVNGTKVITIPRFKPDAFISILQRHKVTVIYAAPPLALFLAHHTDIKSELFDNLKFLMSGAAPLAHKDEERLQAKLGNNIFIFQGYGMTETTGLITTCASKKLMTSTKELRGSIGKPVPNTFVKVVEVGDPTGVPLGPNEPGEILVKGPQIMRGYSNKPKETEESFQNGWLKSGDIGYYDENKVLFVTDRLKELIKVKGYQVAPAELEGILREFPAVKEAAVIGVPHPVFGEAPRACIVPKKNVTLDTEELQRFMAARVAKYKQLSGGIEIVESIPKNPSGKILRRLLKKKEYSYGEMSA